MIDCGILAPYSNTSNIGTLFRVMTELIENTVEEKNEN